MRVVVNKVVDLDVSKRSIDMFKVKFSCDGVDLDFDDGFVGLFF